MNICRSDIKYLFEPRSVAIIGASRDQEKIGYKVVENILSGRYPGKVYPVNPAGGEILGLPVFKSLDEVVGEIDLAVIVIPARFTVAAVRDCAKKGVKHIAVITSGFSEVGNIEDEREIVSIARKSGMRILGPNIFGIYSSVMPINATFGPREVLPGNVAIITQSGALGIALMGKTKSENIGLSAMLSVGNKSDIDEADLLEYLVDHKDTRVIMMYIEGVRNGEKIVQALKAATVKKPVIVIKSGRSKRGAMAAASHTGSLAGADEIFNDVMKQCHVIRAESIQEALDWCKFLSTNPAPAGENTLIITNGGGIGVMAADACEKYGVSLYDDINTLKRIFSQVVPEFGSVKNPVDLTGQASADDFARSLEKAVKNRNIHSVICLACETAVLDYEELGIFLENMYRKKVKKPVVFSLVGGEGIDNLIRRLKPRGVPIYSDVYQAVSCLGVAYSAYYNMVYQPDEPTVVNIDSDRIDRVIRQVRADQRQFLLAHEAGEVMEALGIPMPKSYVARNPGEAVMYAQKIGYPVVMKVVSRDIIHKSDSGGVALDLVNREEVMDAYQAIMVNCRKHNPAALIKGIEVAEMVEKDVETIIGARRDNSFGPVVMFGLGGIYVEVMKDVSFRAFPLGMNETLRMISQIRSFPLLLGVRGEKEKEINGVVDAILKVGTALQKHRDISDIEINPLIVYEEGQGTKALDARILLTKPGEVM